MPISLLIGLRSKININVLNFRFSITGELELRQIEVARADRSMLCMELFQYCLGACHRLLRERNFCKIVDISTYYYIFSDVGVPSPPTLHT